MKTEEQFVILKNIGDDSKVIDYLMSDNSQTQNVQSSKKSNVSSGDKKSVGVTAFDYQDNINQ